MRLIQHIDPRDNALVALRTLEKGQIVTHGSQSWALTQRIPAKHKFTSHDLKQGDPVFMYGVLIGRALTDLPAGSLLSRETLAHATTPCFGKKSHQDWAPPSTVPFQGRTFQGFANNSGPAGTANHWLVIPLVFCENRNIALLRNALVDELGYGKSAPYRGYVAELAKAWRKGQRGVEIESIAFPTSDDLTHSRLFPYVDGVKFLEHGIGCGGTRQDAESLCALLAGYIAHPNVAGATVLSLGCQNAQISLLEQKLARHRSASDKSIHFFEQQKHQSERDMMQQALRTTFLGLAQANERRRSPQPLSDLVLGVECGGSDGFSGISANPVIGHAADVLAALGGAPVLSEFPELCGIEQELCDRCVTPVLADRFLALMKSYAQAAEACGSGFDMNPSPGNIRDGLITDAMKSAGAAKKGGSAPIIDVLDYTEPITKYGGLTLLCTPGNDVESTTALAASGCTLMAFSTGLGTPTGNPICPTLKVSTHTELASRIADIIDFDAGPIISGQATITSLGEAFFEQLIATASGDYTPKAIQLGQDDFLPWKRGVSL